MFIMITLNWIYLIFLVLPQQGEIFDDFNDRMKNLGEFPVSHSFQFHQGGYQSHF